jgi:hypothetical protein
VRALTPRGRPIWWAGATDGGEREGTGARSPAVVAIIGLAPGTFDRRTRTPPPPSPVPKNSGWGLFCTLNPQTSSKSPVTIVFWFPSSIFFHTVIFTYVSLINGGEKVPYHNQNQWRLTSLEWRNTHVLKIQNKENNDGIIYF